MSPGRTVYVLVPRAVYDHGVIGVYDTEADARAAAEKIWPTTDGHHGMTIFTREIGASHDDVFQRHAWEEPEYHKAPGRPVDIEVDPEGPR